jgi:hypothetical protein
LFMAWGQFSVSAARGAELANGLVRGGRLQPCVVALTARALPRAHASRRRGRGELQIPVAVVAPGEHGVVVADVVGVVGDVVAEVIVYSGVETATLVDNPLAVVDRGIEAVTHDALCRLKDEDLADRSVAQCPIEPGRAVALPDVEARDELAGAAAVVMKQCYECSFFRAGSALTRLIERLDVDQVVLRHDHAVR